MELYTFDLKLALLPRKLAILVLPFLIALRLNWAIDSPASPTQNRVTKTKNNRLMLREYLGSTKLKINLNSPRWQLRKSTLIGVSFGDRGPNSAFGEGF